MKIDNYKAVKQETVPGFKGAKIRWLIGQNLGENFLLRRYDFEPNAVIPLHHHSHEHEMYVLAGKGAVLDKTGEHEVGPGDFVYVDPNEVHGFKNKSASETFAFLCIIPKKAGSTHFYEEKGV